MKNAPVCVLPEIHIPGIGIGPGEIISVPIITKGFDDIAAITLNFQFDNSVLNYIETKPNLEIFNYEAGVSPPIFNDPKLPIEDENAYRWAMAWSSLTPINGAADQPLVVINFKYLGGSTNLTWLDDWRPTPESPIFCDCEWANSNAEPLPDKPSSDYYIDGIVLADDLTNIKPIPAPAMPILNTNAPITKIGSLSCKVGDIIDVPITVDGLEKINGITLGFKFEGGIFQYLGYTPADEFSLGDGEGLFYGASPLIGANSKSMMKFDLIWSKIKSITLADGETIGWLKLKVIRYPVNGKLDIMFIDNSTKFPQVKCEYTRIVWKDGIEEGEVQEVVSLNEPDGTYINGTITVSE